MRFVVLRTLGRGGMGQVELVRDAKTGEELARKRLRHVDPARLQALKRELRLVGGLVHPNLVRIYELGEEGGEPFLLMEAVHGDDVVSACRREGRVLPELASTLPQLLRALRFLHGRGIVHGDLSPSNVLVRHDGRVKVLDFGLSVALGAARPERGGTPGYVPPERAEGAPPTAEGDLYALGAILRDIALSSGPEGEGPIPGALASAISRLLDEDPGARPSLDDLERSLLPALSAHHPSADLPRPTVVSAPERRPALRRDWLESHVFGMVVSEARQVVVLRGRSGVGKTWLARVVSERAARAGMSVSWARARPESSLPFDLIDELVDDACERLSRGPVAAEVRAAAERASSVFPVLVRLAGVESHAELVRRAVRARLFGREGADPEVIEPRASRARLFDDLRTVIEAVEPSLQGRVLVLDDLQWADGDSLAFLASLLDFGGARCTVLATMRDDATSLDGWLGARSGVSFVEVGPLPTEEVRRFVEEYGGFDPPTASRVAEASEGLPAMVELALRTPGSVDPLRDAVGAVVRDGEHDEKRALAALLVANGPLGLDDHDVSRRALDMLARRGLVVRSGSGVDLLHDSLRAPLRAALGPDWLRAAHESRARSSSLPDTQVVRHLLGAGRVEEAAALARHAAERAESMHAYGLAADLFTVAMRAEETPELRRRQGEALVRAGRFDEAANVWSALGRDASSDQERAELYLAEAHAHFAGRRIAKGRQCLDAALQASGEPGLSQSLPRRLFTIARFLAGPIAVKRRETLTADTAERFLRNAALVGYFDTVHGLELLLRARDAFARLGSRASEHAAWCDFLLAFFARSAHVRGRRLALRYRRAAERRLGERAASSAVVRSFPAFLDAYDALRDADFRGAAERLDTVLDGVVGTSDARSFEVHLTTSLRTSAVLATQNVDAAEAAVARFAALAHGGVDVAVQCHVENARSLVATWRGRFEEAADTMTRLRAGWPREPVTVQHLLIEVYAALPEVLLGQAQMSRARLRRALHQTRHLAILRGAYGPIVAGIAAMTELAAHHVEGDGDLRAARRWATLSASRPSVMTGMGHRTLAALDDLEGRPARAEQRLLHAEREALRLGQAIDVALARYALGRRTGRFSLESEARVALSAVGASPRLFVEYDRLRSARPCAPSHRPAALRSFA